MTRGTRTSLTVIFGGGAMLLLLSCVLVAAGLVGYRDWDAGRRLLALGMGSVLAVVMGSMLALIWRQQVLGRPSVEIASGRIAVGLDLIPWSEIDEVAPFFVFGLPHVALVQAPSTPRRLRGLGRVHYQTRGGQRFVFLAERQLGQDVTSGASHIRSTWLRYRLAPGSIDESMGSETDG
jgi:hypothetical protein